MIATIQRNWWIGLTGILIVYYVALAVASGGITGIAAMWGVILVGLALGARTRSIRLAGALLLIGVLPLSLLTWWSAVTPLLGLLILVCGGSAITTARRPSRARAGRTSVTL